MFLGDVAVLVRRALASLDVLLVDKNLNALLDHADTRVESGFGLVNNLVEHTYTKIIIFKTVYCTNIISVNSIKISALSILGYFFTQKLHGHHLCAFKMSRLTLEKYLIKVNHFCQLNTKHLICSCKQ